MVKRRRPPEGEGKGEGEVQSCQLPTHRPDRAITLAASKIDDPPFEKAEKALAIKVEQAMASLAVAHAEMTELEIRERAQRLAACLLGNARALGVTSEVSAASLRIQRNRASTGKNIMILIHQAASSIVIGDQAQAIRNVRSLSPQLGVRRQRQVHWNNQKG